MNKWPFHFGFSTDVMSVELKKEVQKSKRKTGIGKKKVSNLRTGRVSQEVIPVSCVVSRCGTQMLTFSVASNFVLSLNFHFQRLCLRAGR